MRTGLTSNAFWRYSSDFIILCVVILHTLNATEFSKHDKGVRRSPILFFIKIAMVSLSCMQCMPGYDLPFWWGSGRKRVSIWCYQASFWLAGTINTSIQRSRVRVGAGNVIFPRHRFVVGLHSSRVFIADARKRVPRCTLRPVFGARVCRVPNRECQTPKLVRLNAVFTFWA